jgi:hypothetical protein
MIVPSLFSDFERNRRVRPAVLQPRLHDAARAAAGAVQVQVPLVLLRGVRGVCEGRPDIHLQLIPSRHAQQRTVTNPHCTTL